jgi:hypothetical protein
MNAAMTIADFNVFMSSKQENNVLATILHNLTTLQKPEDVIAAVKNPPKAAASWSGWGY